MSELEVIKELDFSLSEALDILKPLLLLLAEITVYALFVYVFYRFMSRRDILKSNLHKYGKARQRNMRTFTYGIQHFLVFPILAVGWTAVLVIVLALLGEDQEPENVLLVSVALICTIRITAYIREDLSRDLAKMLPFAILGLFLVDKSYISLEVSWGVLKEIPDFWEVIVYYIILVVIVELAMRILNYITSPFKITPVPLKKQPVTEEA